MNPEKVKRPQVTKYHGIIVVDYGPVPNSPVRMPCGFIIAPPESGWPRRDIPCPCGDEKHTVIAFQKSAIS